MNRAKRTRLTRAGWRVGSPRELLGLSTGEAAFIELKLSLGTTLRSVREAHGLTQAAVARRIGSSQSRVAKMEAGDLSVSSDLLIRALFELGMTPRELARCIASTKRRRAS